MIHSLTKEWHECNTRNLTSHYISLQTVHRRFLIEQMIFFFTSLLYADVAATPWRHFWRIQDIIVSQWRRTGAAVAVQLTECIALTRDITSLSTEAKPHGGPTGDHVRIKGLHNTSRIRKSPRLLHISEGQFLREFPILPLLLLTLLFL